MMKLAPFTGLALAALLAACGGQDEAPEAEAPAAGETAPAEVEAPAGEAETGAPTAEDLTLARLRGACRATLAAVHGQNVDSVRVDGLEGTTVNLSWPAPVDGGRSTAQCRIEGDVVTWRPTGLPDPDQMVWRNRREDPLITYEVDGPRVTVNVLNQDGTTATAQALVASEEEVR